MEETDTPNNVYAEIENQYIQCNAEIEAKYEGYKRHLKQNEPKRMFNRVLRELLEVAMEKKFNSIDTTNFKYEDYEDALLLICYQHYMESSATGMPMNKETMKKYIINMSDYANDCKRNKICVFSI